MLAGWENFDVNDAANEAKKDKDREDRLAREKELGIKPAESQLVLHETWRQVNTDSGPRNVIRVHKSTTRAAEVGKERGSIKRQGKKLLGKE